MKRDDTVLKRAVAPKRLLTALVVGVVFGLAPVVLDDVTSPSPQPASAPQKPPAAEAPLTQTDLQQVRSALGPFTVIPVLNNTPTPETKAPAVLILNQNGSTEASERWTVLYHTVQWSRRDSFYIRSVSMTLGYATIGTSSGQVFVVKAGQPFLLEADPGHVLVVDASGLVYQLTTDRAEALRQPLQ